MLKPRVKKVKYVRNWQDMAGINDLEKMVNSYLTSRFIWTKDIPADECLSEARAIISGVAAYCCGMKSDDIFDGVLHR